jgi:hypothetical protein
MLFNYCISSFEVIVPVIRYAKVFINFVLMFVIFKCCTLYMYACQCSLSLHLMFFFQTVLFLYGLGTVNLLCR